MEHVAVNNKSRYIKFNNIAIVFCCEDVFWMGRQLIKLICLLSFFINTKLVFADAVVNIYTTSNYIADSTIQSFQKSCNCRLFLNYFSDPQEMLAKIAAGAVGYDVIIGTGYAEQDLNNMGKLESLDLNKFSNFKNISPQFLHQQFDLNNSFSVPYAYTMTIAGYNKTALDKLKIVPDTWAVFFDEKYLQKLKGRVTVFDSQRNVYAAALLYLGKDPNSIDKQDLELARKTISKASRYWARYDSTTYYRSLLNGDIWLAMSYSNDLFNTIEDAKKSKLSFKISGMSQREGNMIELDNLVIPKSAPNKKLAYQFINHVLSKHSAYSLSIQTGSSVPNLAATKDLPRSLTKVDWIYPILNQKIYGFTAYPPKTRILTNEVWTELKMQCH